MVKESVDSAGKLHVIYFSVSKFKVARDHF